MSIVTRMALRGGLGFGAGGLLTILMQWLVSVANDPAAEPSDFTFYGIILSYVLAGVIGVTILARGSGRVIFGSMGFGCGFLLTFFCVLFTSISLQGGGKPEYLWGMAGCGIGFAIGGLIGGLCLQPRLALISALTFGIGGAIYGPLMFLNEYHGSELGLPDAVNLIIGLCLNILPFAIGGAGYGAALGLMYRPKEKQTEIQESERIN